jgi:hypothetical protein
MPSHCQTVGGIGYRQPAGPAHDGAGLPRARRAAPSRASDVAVEAALAAVMRHR